MYEREMLRNALKLIGAWLLAESMYVAAGVLPLGMGLNSQALFMLVFWIVTLLVAVVVIAGAGRIADWLWHGETPCDFEEVAALRSWFHLILVVAGVYLLTEAVVQFAAYFSPAGPIDTGRIGNPYALILASVQFLLGACFIFGWGFKREFGEA